VGLELSYTLAVFLVCGVDPLSPPERVGVRGRGGPRL